MNVLKVEEAPRFVEEIILFLIGGVVVFFFTFPIDKSDKRRTDNESLSLDFPLLSRR